MGIEYQSDRISTNDRIAVWHDVIQRSYVPLNITVTSQRDFIGTVSTDQLSSVRVATSASRAQRIVRTRRLIRQDDHDNLMVGVQSSGAGLVRQRGREAQLVEGGFVFWDTRYPYDIVFPGDWRMTVFQFPRGLFGFPEGLIDQLTAVPISGDRGVGRIVSTFMRSIADEAATGELAENSLLMDRAVGLLSMAIQQKVNSPTVDTNHLFGAVVEYISNNLSNPDLSPPMIAAQYGVSVRTLHRVFTGTGEGIAERIRRLRLERIRSELADPRGQSRTIGAVIRKWGILDPPNFSRLFKAAYGITAREWVATSRGPAAG